MWCVQRPSRNETRTPAGLWRRGHCRRDNMNDIKEIKAEAESRVEAILEELEEKGIRVFRLQVFPRHKQAPEVCIVVDEKGTS